MAPRVTLVSKVVRILVYIICLGCSFLSCEREPLMVDKANVELELVNGVLHYKNLPFTGFLLTNYDEATSKMRLEYVDGRKDGVEKQWHVNGRLAQSRLYSEGIKVGNHSGWWEDGTKKFDYHFNENGEYHGNRKEWYSNGQLVRDFNYSNGKEVGSQRMWTDSGKIRANYVVKNGERFGLIGLKKCYTLNTDSNELQ